MSEYMFNLVARLGVEHGLNELYPFPDDYNDNISLYTLRNANIGHPYFSLLIKQHSMKLFYNLINLAPGLEYVIGLSGPFRFSRRQDRPMNSYNSHTYHDFWTNRSRSMSNAYVTITCDNELIELIEYPSLIIHGQMDPKVAIQESFGFSELKLIFGDNWEIYKKLYFSKFLAP